MANFPGVVVVWGMSAVDCVNFCEAVVLKKAVVDTCVWKLYLFERNNMKSYNDVYCVFQSSRPTQDVEGAVGREDSHLVPGA